MRAPLPKVTPRVTIPIDYFIVKFKDGSLKTVNVDDGDGYYREEELVGEAKSLTTYQCFIATKEKARGNKTVSDSNTTNPVG